MRDGALTRSAFTCGAACSSSISRTHGTCTARPAMDCGARPPWFSCAADRVRRAERMAGHERTHAHTHTRRAQLTARLRLCPARRPVEFERKTEAESERERKRDFIYAVHGARTTLPSDVRRTTAVRVRVATPRNQSKCQKRATAHAPARHAPSYYADQTRSRGPIRFVPTGSDPCRESHSPRGRLKPVWSRQAGSILDARRRFCFSPRDDPRSTKC